MTVIVGNCWVKCALRNLLDLVFNLPLLSLPLLDASPELINFVPWEFSINESGLQNMHPLGFTNYLVPIASTKLIILWTGISSICVFLLFFALMHTDWSQSTRIAFRFNQFIVTQRLVLFSNVLHCLLIQPILMQLWGLLIAICQECYVQILFDARWRVIINWLTVSFQTVVGGLIKF